MNFTFFTFVVAVIWVSIFAKVISCLRKRMMFFRYFSIYSLLLILLLCIMRLLLPIEFPYTRILDSENVLPMIYSFINKPLFHLGYFNICIVQILLTLWVSASKDDVETRIGIHGILFPSFLEALFFFAS